MSAITDAIAAHKAAWQAFQDAPTDELDPATIDAAFAEDEAFLALVNTIPESAADFTALESHLRWFDAEERKLREGHAPYNIGFAMLAVVDFARGAAP